MRDLEDILARGTALWEALRGESVFLTGGTGFFGRWFLESALHADRKLGLGLRITVLTRNAAEFRRSAPHLADAPGLSFHEGDIADFIFPESGHTHVIHAATTTAAETYHGVGPLRKFDTLVAGTRHVLEYSARAGVRRFLFVSSGAAYGASANDQPCFREDYAGAPATNDPASALGEAKRAAEFLCACYAREHGWQLAIGRCFSFVGPLLPLDLHYAIGNFIRQALLNEGITIKGDGTPVRSYLYMADLVLWLLALLIKGESGRIYNVGSDQAISIFELAHLVRDTLNSGQPVRVLGQSPYSVGNIIRNSYVPDISRARGELNVDVWTPLPKAIKATADHVVDSLQHNPA